MGAFFQRTCFICGLFIFTAFLSAMFAKEVEPCQNEGVVKASSCQKIAEKSRKREIEDFFSDLFSRELGYTLIGVKPISTDEVYGEYFQEISESCFEQLKKMFVGSPNFVLKIFPRGRIHSVELINRRVLREVVRNNPIVRAFIKKEFKSEEDFYSEIEDPNRSIHKILKKDARIIGYLLGYGETNIEYYIRRIDVGTYLQKYPLVRFHPLPGGKYSDCPVVFLNMHLQYERLKPSKGFDSLEAEWQWIKQVAWDITEESKPVPPYFVSLPFYICRHGGDSELTRERYKTASCELAELFYNRSFREAVAETALRR